MKNVYEHLTYGRWYVRINGEEYQYEGTEGGLYETLEAVNPRTVYIECVLKPNQWVHELTVLKQLIK
jgi:hypothetical protein